jgi:NitT/TauT family transport system substrate-binding protein
VQDLKGKRIAVLAGASPEYFAERALQAHGVPLSAVHLVNITDPPNMVIALQRGDVDAISIWEPLAAKAMDAVGDDGIEFQDSSAYVEHFCLVTTTAVLADRAKAAMLSRLVETIKHVSQHLNTDSPPDDAVSLIAQRTGIEPNTLRRVWYNFHFPGTLDSSLTDTLRTIEDWEASTNQNPPRSAVELSRLIDTDIERAAR